MTAAACNRPVVHSQPWTCLSMNDELRPTPGLTPEAPSAASRATVTVSWWPLCTSRPHGTSEIDEGLTMNEIINNLMETNLLGVFNERDARRRAAAIETTYAPDVRWTDDEGVSVGCEALEAKAKALQAQMEGLVFTKPVLYTKPADWDTWSGSSGLRAATPWPAD